VGDVADSDDLTVSELVPAAGGQWHGVLFDNPTVGLTPRLNWSFTFAFADVSRDYGSSPVALDIEWVPLTTETWRDMSGQAVTSPRFAEPAEASIYFFEHHRFEKVDLRIVGQRELKIRVTANVSGDLDALGVDSLAVDQWLTFTGIHVSLSAARNAESASAQLRKFHEVTGLTCRPGSAAGTFLFSPSN
jgi:hypothetical protein